MRGSCRELIGGLLYALGCGVEADCHVAQGLGEGGGFFYLECGWAAVDFVAVKTLCEPLGGATEISAGYFAEVDESAYFEGGEPYCVCFAFDF